MEKWTKDRCYDTLVSKVKIYLVLIAPLILTLNKGLPFLAGLPLLYLIWESPILTLYLRNAM